jgi:hypothetical protein
LKIPAILENFAKLIVIKDVTNDVDAHKVLDNLFFSQ